jgi:hypothetical protein
MHPRGVNTPTMIEDVTAAETRRSDQTIHRSVLRVGHGRTTRQSETETMSRADHSPASLSTAAAMAGVTLKRSVGSEAQLASETVDTLTVLLTTTLTDALTTEARTSVSSVTTSEATAEVISSLTTRACLWVLTGAGSWHTESSDAGRRWRPASPR